MIKMKLLVLLMLCYGLSAYAEPFVYFKQADAVNESISAWNIGTNEILSLGIDGYFIEDDSGEPGCLIVSVAPKTDHENAKILRLYDGRIQEELAVSIPHDTVRVFAYKSGWLYYQWQDANGAYGLRRIHGDGEIQIYDLNEKQLLRYSNWMEEMQFSINSQGVICYWGEFAPFDMSQKEKPCEMYIAYPGKEPRLIYASEDNCSDCLWISETEILFIGSHEKFEVLNAESGEIRAFVDMDDSKMGSIDSMVGVAVDDTMQFVAWHPYQPVLLYGFIPLVGDENTGPLMVYCAEAGEITKSPIVELSYFPNNNYLPQMQIAE